VIPSFFKEYLFKQVFFKKEVLGIFRSYRIITDLIQMESQCSIYFFPYLMIKIIIFILWIDFN